MRVSSLSLVAALLIAALSVPLDATAQEAAAIPVPAVEVSAGYTFLRDFNDYPGNINFPAGWYAGGGVNLNRWFGLVGEATGSYTRNLRFDYPYPDDEFGRMLEENLRYKYRMFSLMGGPRFSFKRGRVVPFLQVLAGGVRLRTDLTVEQPIAGMRAYTDRQNQFALQPGGGLTVYVTERIGVRFAADHRLIIDFDEDGNEYDSEFRAAAGLVFGWGHR